MRHDNSNRYTRIKAIDTISATKHVALHALSLMNSQVFTSTGNYDLQMLSSVEELSSVVDLYHLVTLE